MLGTHTFIIGGTMSGPGQVACFPSGDNSHDILERNCVVIKQDGQNFSIQPPQTIKCCLNEAVHFRMIGPDMANFIEKNKDQIASMLF